MRRWLKITARLDTECVRRNIFSGRDRASEEIRKGTVSVDGKVITKPSFSVSQDASICFSGEDLKISRAQVKIRKALDEFKIDPSGKSCLDVGASAGGFTMELLSRGASDVIALDVGHGQLREELRRDKRVTSLEGYNFRYIDKKDFKNKFSIITMDVSFISVTLLADSVDLLLEDGGDFALLVKPQFEAGKGALNSKGVVKDISDHKKVLLNIGKVYGRKGLRPLGLCESPIKGPEGNTEYLLHFKKNEKLSREEDMSNLIEGHFKYVK